MSPKTHVGVLLFDEAYDHLSEALKLYLQKGPIGNYIYGSKAENDGIFLNVTIEPDEVKNLIRDTMVISIPLRFVKFVVSSPSKDLIGFA
ncbi:hypothetical protein ACFL7M_06425 [Thermodesulfobacteriota bacterium]